jgi:hypothetical protein
MIFSQLRQYLVKGAPAEYVTKTVLKLMKTARERRFEAYLQLLPAQLRKDMGVSQLRREWPDAVPYRLKTRHEGRASVWQVQESAHQARLALLMHQWIVQDKEPQLEVEERLRFFTMEEGGSESEKGSQAQEPGSFLAAVQKSDEDSRDERGSERERLQKLCLQVVTVTTKLRKRTADEKKALVMILNHEIEVPTIPPFLRLSMTPGELAVFEDIFMALEYPLYAHLEPGQRFYDNLTSNVVVEQISGGPEAAAAHTREIEEFKGDLARISLDNAARTVKVTFKNKAKAVKWVGWLMPLGNRTLPLVDYEMIRERAKRTHELVMLDYYSFTIEVRTGEMSSRGMYELLTSSLGLQVQELEHSASPTTGLMERQWRVRVHSHGCPPGLRAKSHVVQGEVEAVLHHAAIHVNWPCRRCRAPEHPYS